MARGYGRARFGRDKYGKLDLEVSFRYRTTAPVVQVVPWRYAIMAALKQVVPFRYESQALLKHCVPFRYQVGWLSHVVPFRYRIHQEFSQAVPFRYQVWTQAFEDAWQSNQGRPEITIQVERFGTVRDISSVAYELDIDLVESGPASWTLSIFDELGHYNPENADSPWFDWMTDEPYGATGATVRRILVTVVQGGMTFEFEGEPDGFGYAVGEDQLLRFQWKGKDRSRRLYRQNLTLPTQRSSLAGVVSSHSILDLVGQAGQVRLDLRSDDLPIPVMHLQESKPAEFLDDILALSVGRWQMKGDTLRTYQPELSSPQFTYDLAKQIVKSLQVDSSLPKLVNQKTMRRAREVGAGANEPIQATTFGPLSSSFGRPLYGVGWKRLRENGGRFSDFVFRNSGGNVIAVHDVRSGIPWPASLLGVRPDGAVSVEFVWGNISPDQLVLEGAGEIQFTGHSGDNPDSLFGSAWDDKFTVTVRVPDSVKRHGLEPETSDPSPLIANSQVARKKAERELYWAFAERKPVAMEVPLNILLEPGMTLRQKYSLIGRNVLIYVKQAGLRLRPVPGACRSVIQAVEPKDLVFEVVEDPEAPAE